MGETQLPTGIKSKILEAISNHKSSASEIAKELKISLPYALTQLTILEAKNLVKIDETKGNKQVGKPKKIYAINQEKIEISLLGEGFGKRFVCNKVDPQLRTYFQLLSIIDDENKTNFSEYYWKHNKYIKKIIELAIIKNTQNSIEFVAITGSENLSQLRDNISNYKTESGYTIICWVHSEEEIIKGLKENDDYYIKLIKKAKPILETRGVFEILSEQIK